MRFRQGYEWRPLLRRSFAAMGTAIYYHTTSPTHTRRQIKMWASNRKASYVHLSKQSKANGEGNTLPQLWVALFRSDLFLFSLDLF
jgi:hypothetical protein